MDNFLSEWGQNLNNMPYGPLGIIAMNGIDELGGNVNNYLLKWHELQDLQDEEFYTSPGLGREDFLIDAACPRFGTGEGKGVIKESVRGYDIYILVDVCAYNVKYRMYDMEVPMSPDDHFQDLKRIIAAIAGKATRVNVIMPMLYESRQHRRNTRESLDAAMALQELQSMGVANIITFDAHDSRVMNAIPLCGFENVMPTYQMLKALLRSVKDLHIDKDNLMVVSPDEGAVQRNIYYASVMALELGMFYKRRDYTTIVSGRNPIVAHEYLGDSVEGGHEQVHLLPHRHPQPRPQPVGLAQPLQPHPSPDVPLPRRAGRQRHQPGLRWTASSCPSPRTRGCRPRKRIRRATCSANPGTSSKARWTPSRGRNCPAWWRTSPGTW